MAEDENQSDLQVFTLDDFRQNPDAVVKATDNGPVEVVDETGQRRIYFTCPADDEQAAAE